MIAWGRENRRPRNLAERVEADSKAASMHATEVNKSVASVARALESVGQNVTTRLDEQDRRIEFLAKSAEQAAQKPGALQQEGKQTQRSVPPTSRDLERPRTEQELNPVSRDASEVRTAPVAIVVPQESPVADATQSHADPSDKARYERVLAQFRDGDLEGARHGFTAFLSEYPNSDLAPNARYWQGESYYGKKDFLKAINAYDRVELDYPGSDKVPAAILKKGYAYLALKDKKQASSAFKQVLTLYPKSPEAGKASAKLAQIKEGGSLQ